jgi:hypothetical protein
MRFRRRDAHDAPEGTAPRPVAVMQGGPSQGELTEQQRSDMHSIALQLAARGRSRAETDDYIQGIFGVDAPAEVLDSVFGRTA